MPTPLDILLDPVSLIFLGIYAALILWEAAFPARNLPEVKSWKLMGFMSFLLFFYLSSYLPLWLDPLLEPYRLFDLTEMPVWVAFPIGVLLYQLGMYAWHRSMHRSDLLWRTFHQMHHSAERVDTWGAFWFSPMDMIGFTLLGSLCFGLVIGLGPTSITAVLLFLNFLSVFQHANIRTPRWLGYLIQRPESHTVHHARGLHRHNYADLPIFDLIFGTFENPTGFDHETGFYPGASSRLREMLTFRAVHEPKPKS